MFLCNQVGCNIAVVKKHIRTKTSCTQHILATTYIVEKWFGHFPPGNVGIKMRSCSILIAWLAVARARGGRGMNGNAVYPFAISPVQSLFQRAGIIQPVAETGKGFGRNDG